MIRKIKNSIIARIKYLILNLNEIQGSITIERSNNVVGTIVQGSVRVGQKNSIKNSEIHGDVRIGNNCLVEFSRIKGDILIGNDCKLYHCRLNGKVVVGRFTSLWGPNLDVHSSKEFPVKIGNFCSIAKNLTIQTYNHNLRKPTTYFIGKNFFKENWSNEIVSKGGVEIMNDVWIGAHCVILGGVKVGNGAVIAANSLVNKDVPDYAIVGGTPAVVLGYRFDKDLIQRLLELEWWYWDDSKLNENKGFFKSNEINLKQINELLEKNN